jgi:hypothetical protein
VRASPPETRRRVPPAGADAPACGYLGSPLARHRVVYRRHLVARGIERAVFHDPRNLAWVCSACRQRQHNAAQMLALPMLPDAALEFALEVHGAHATRAHLTSRCRGNDTRLR